MFAGIDRKKTNNCLPYYLWLNTKNSVGNKEKKIVVLIFLFLVYNYLIVNETL